MLRQLGSEEDERTHGTLSWSNRFNSTAVVIEAKFTSDSNSCEGEHDYIPMGERCSTALRLTFSDLQFHSGSLSPGSLWHTLQGLGGRWSIRLRIGWDEPVAVSPLACLRTARPHPGNMAPARVNVKCNVTP